MRLFMVIAIVIFAMPITGFGWAEGSNILLDPYLMCRKARRLRGKMSEICRHDSTLLREIINGINLGFRECEFQFRNRRWNCTALRKSMRKILMKDTRETGFVNAITSAGATYAITKACTLGNLMECSCDRNHFRRNGGQPQMVNAITAVAALERQQMSYVKNSSQRQRERERQRERQLKNKEDLSENIGKRKRKLFKNIQLPDGEWEWGGCNDNVNFGFTHSRQFLDAKYRRRSDLHAMIRLHNNRAGRLIIRNSMRLECKCHGLSGSCTVKTCWFKMPPFREVSAHLRDKYDNACKVVLRNDGKSFMAENAMAKQPAKNDLVYSDDSVDFCAPNVRTGSLGTRGRECHTNSSNADNCDHLCCNRGHKRLILSEWVNCKCAFKWCCEVTCEKCLEKREIFTCL